MTFERQEKSGAAAAKSEYLSTLTNRLVDSKGARFFL